jgi:DNA-binding transcriptional regulator YhcF (GntR family)
MNQQRRRTVASVVAEAASISHRGLVAPNVHEGEDDGQGRRRLIVTVDDRKGLLELGAQLGVVAGRDALSLVDEAEVELQADGTWDVGWNDAGRDQVTDGEFMPWWLLDQAQAWVQIAARLYRTIRAGRFHAGVPLPTEAQLARTHQVSIGTVRQAYAALQEAGLVVVQHGKGRFLPATAEEEAVWPNLSRTLRNALAEALTGEGVDRTLYMITYEPGTGQTFIRRTADDQVYDVTGLQHAAYLAGLDVVPVDTAAPTFIDIVAWLLELDEEPDDMTKTAGNV